MSTIAAAIRADAYLFPPLERKGSRAASAGALLAGAAFDLAVRSGIAGVAGALAVVVVTAVLISSGRVRNAQARALCAMAPLFGMWLAIRASAWLLPFDVIAAASLLLLGSSLASGGSLFDVSVPDALARTAQAVLQFFTVPSFLAASRTPRAEGAARAKAVARGVALATPLVILIGALFASGDAVFADAFRVDLGPLTSHVALIAVGCLGAGWLMRLASLRRVERPVVPVPRLGSTEWTVVLGALDVVLAAFAVAQLVAVRGGATRILRTAGMTYAEYARSGFFQLLAAAMITTIALMTLRGVSDETHRGRFRVLSGSAIALTLVVVASAFQRLVLYEHAFGLTMLRLYVHIAIVGVGVVLLAVGVSIAGFRSGRPWLAPSIGSFMLAVLFALNIANPEAIVARYNLTHRSTRFDRAYLSSLSDDAAQPLKGRPELCRSSSAEGRGWLGFNASRFRAEQLRKENCG